MMELQTLLQDSGIGTAVVIDDVFDDAPRPDELDAGDWSTFFDDLAPRDHDQLAVLFPEYDDTNQGDLQESQQFIDILWENRQELSDGPLETLFRDYEITNSVERAQLEKLVEVLEGTGLTCTKIGRDLSGHEENADLIVIDLFLGRQQTGDDMERAVQRARELVSGRVQNPPIVILTSKSTRLNENRDVFRDDAGLLGSTFRVASKSELVEDGALESMLSRLALHYEDAKRVAGFVHAWDNGLDQARKNFIRMLRRLDLSDLGQISGLLLDVAGESLGEYLLNVADRVLQHEIESVGETITAALELNKIDLAKYPAPHLNGTSDLQQLVYRMVFSHKDRLRLSEDNDKVNLQFGDVLRWKNENEDAYGDNVSLVVSPACDLARRGTERVLLLSGNLENLQARDWSYKYRPVRTAVMLLPDESRKWIKWNLKDVRTLEWTELDALLGNRQRLTRIGRLREIYALEIQETLLSDLGRIGRPATMPVPFSVTVSMFFIDAEGNARKLIDDIESAACYVGRDQDSKPVHHLVLTEQQCDKIDQSIQALAEESVLQSAQASLTAVKEDRSFITKFERGEVDVKPEMGTKFIRPEDNLTYAAIVRGEKLDEGATVPGNLRRAAIVVYVTDITDDGNNQGVG